MKVSTHVLHHPEMKDSSRGWVVHAVSMFSLQFQQAHAVVSEVLT